MRHTPTHPPFDHSVLKRLDAGEGLFYKEGTLECTAETFPGFFNKVPFFPRCFFSSFKSLQNRKEIFFQQKKTWDFISRIGVLRFLSVADVFFWRKSPRGFEYILEKHGGTGCWSGLLTKIEASRVAASNQNGRFCKLHGHSRNFKEYLGGGFKYFSFSF